MMMDIAEDSTMYSGWDWYSRPTESLAGSPTELNSPTRYGDALFNPSSQAVPRETGPMEVQGCWVERDRKESKGAVLQKRRRHT